MTLRFISDLHLDASRPHVAAGFRQLLVDSVAAGVQALYILGDLFEMWIGDDDDAAFHVDLTAALARAAQHMPVFVMRGNRDFLLGEAFARRCGVTLLDEQVVLPIGGQPVLLLHGDELCTDDVQYQQVRQVLRSAAWQQEVLARPLAERRALGQAMRGESQARTGQLDPGIMDVAPAAVASTFAQHDCRLMIHGHTHRPAIHRDGERRRIVLGDWAHTGWYLDIGAGGPERLTRFALPQPG